MLLIALELLQLFRSDGIVLIDCVETESQC